MTLFKFIRFLLSHYPKRIPILILMLTVSGLLESIGIGAVIPIFEFFFQGHSHTSTNTLSRFFYITLEQLHIPLNLRSLFGLIIFIFSLKSLLAFLQHWFMEHIIFYFHKKQSQNLFQAIISAEIHLISHKNYGALTNLFAIEMQNFLTSIRQSIFILTEIALLFFYLLLSFILSIKLTLLIVLLLIVSALPIKKIHHHIRLFSKRSLDARDQFFDLLQQLISGIKFIKSSGYNQKSTCLFNENLNHKASIEYKAHILVGILPSSFILFSIISLSIIAYLALVTFHLSFTYFLLITIIFYRIYPKFQALQLAYQFFNTHVSSIDTINSSLQDFNKLPERYKEGSFSGLKQGIQFKDVSFSYGDKASFSIHQINLNLDCNEFLGIIGPSGCGKTTIMDLLLGLIKPSSGTLLIDKIPLSDYQLPQFRQQIGLVSQDTFLFNDTIRNNLIWGLSADPSEKDLQKACQQAHLSSFIETLPDGFDTIIGERGVKLSGGQRQRLSLARAIIKKPCLLILDEATSALDAESESSIQKSIQALKGKLTLIIISHRLATVKQADRILVMDKGAIIEEGNWQVLSKNKGLFQRFKDLQVLD